MQRLMLAVVAVAGFVGVAQAVTEYVEDGYTYYQLSDGVYCGTTKLCTGGSVIVGYTTMATENVDLAIPSMLGGQAVVALYTDDFKSKDWLRTLIVPASVRAINDGAFSGCTNLVSASLAGDVYSLKRTYMPSGEGLGTKVDVAEWAPSTLFYKCSALSEVALNGTTIGSQAFVDCRNLTAVHFGDDLEAIGSQAFLRAGLKSLDIPATVKAVYSEAFGGCASLESVRFETGARIGGAVKWGAGTVTDWNSSIFYGCTNLKSVVFSEGQEYVGESMFSGCTALENVTLSSTITNIYGSAFYGCTKLPKISIPSSVKMVGALAFVYCSSLSEIEFAEGLKTIGEKGFERCGVKQVKFPSTLHELGIYAFDGCKALTSVEFKAPVIGGVSFGESQVQLRWAFCNCSSLKSVQFAEGQEFIGDSMFSSCTSLESVCLPNSITNIGASAFYTCESLKTIDLPEQLLTLGASVFAGCKSLVRVSVPQKVTVIPYRFCLDATSLREVNIPNGVIEIGSQAFLRAGLTRLDIPPSVKTMDEAFEQCGSLTFVRFCEGVQTIGKSAFAKCERLSEIEVPDSISEIGASAFSGCKSLVYTPRKGIEIGAYAFYGVPGFSQFSLSEDSVVLTLGKRNAVVRTINVPKQWFVEKGFAASVSSVDETTACACGANGYAAWKSYVTGLDPNDEKSKFVANISFDRNGLPVIGCTVNGVAPSSNLNLVTLGKRTLSEAGWEEVTSANRSEMRFFTVSVEVR